MGWLSGPEAQKRGDLVPDAGSRSPPEEGPQKREDLVLNTGPRIPQKKEDLVPNAGTRSPEEGRSGPECRHQKPQRGEDLVPNAGTRSPEEGRSGT